MLLISGNWITNGAFSAATGSMITFGRSSPQPHLHPHGCDSGEEGERFHCAQTAKNASIRGAGGHRLTNNKCTSLQTQVKKIVKGVTAEDIDLEIKVNVQNFRCHKT